MSNDDKVTVLNTVTGRTGKIDRRWFEHSVTNPGVLVEVPAGTKPRVAALHKPQTAEEYLASHIPHNDLDIEPVADESEEEN